jgi:CRP-like cAMP-binding protein
MHKLLVVLTRRLRATDAHVESLAFLSAPGRVARLILHLADDAADPTPEGKPRFISRMTRQEMANITGTSRETFTRILMEYQERRLLTVDRQHFVIENPSKLKSLIV